MANETSTHPPLEEKELDLSMLLAGVIALLIVAIVVVCSLVVVVWFLRLKHSRSLRISTNLSIRVSNHNGSTPPPRSNGRDARSYNETSISHTNQAQNNGCSNIHNSNGSLPSISSPALQGSRDKLCSNTGYASTDCLSPEATKKRSTAERPSSYMCPNPMYSSTDNLTPRTSHFLTEEEIEFGKRHVATSNIDADPSPIENDYDLPNELSFSSSLVQSYVSVCDNLITDVSSRDFEHIEVRADHFHEVRVLGEGQFGQVILAETVGPTMKDLIPSSNGGSPNVRRKKHGAFKVAVKKLKPGSDDEVKKAFNKETKLMMQLNHENIIRLLGVCQGDDGGFIVMEYMENGDLNQHLKKHTIYYPPLNTPQGCSPMAPSGQVSVPTLMFMSVQIARGMEYLSSMHFIHRDLATRNCLVGLNNIVKISDFGLSRSLYGSHYYKIKGCAVLPIRWMASECFYGKFSEKSDVWAFGVTVWEIFMLARRQPYDTMLNPEFIQDAMKGSERQLLSRPRHCPTEVYRDVMLRCWAFDPEQRADFSKLRHILEHKLHSIEQ